MSIEIEASAVSCGTCGAHVSELRRGRCWGCYTQWMEQRPVGRGATCVVCFERRRDNLRLMELRNRSMPVCHTCAAHIVKLLPMPETIEGLRASLRRERRAEDRRGDDGNDQRIFPRERRVGDRRDGPTGERRSDTDPAIAMASFDDLVIEIGDADIEEIEQTIVRDMRPRLADAR